MPPERLRPRERPMPPERPMPRERAMPPEPPVRRPPVRRPQPSDSGLGLFDDRPEPPRRQPPRPRQIPPDDNPTDVIPVEDYDLYEDEFGDEIEVHYFRHPDGRVADVKVKPRS